MAKVIYTSGPSTNDKGNAVLLFTPDEKADDLVRAYSFQVRRLKSTESHLERIEITALERDEFVAVITGKFTSLQDDMAELQNYGVVLTTAVFGTLKAAIEKVYATIPKMDTTFDDELSDEVLEKLKDLIRANIAEDGIEATDSTGGACYNVPTNTFNAWISNSELYKLNLRDIKVKLAEKGLIRTDKGRYDKSVKIKVDGESKNAKHISFYQKELDKAVEAVEDGKGKGESKKATK